MKTSKASRKTSSYAKLSIERTISLEYCVSEVRRLKVYLCHTDKCCPAVEFADEHVLIGEDDNTVKLTKDQWNILVEKIKNNELRQI